MRANYRRTIFLVSSMLVAGIVVTGCSSGSSTDTSSSGGAVADSGAKAAAPEQAVAQPDGATAKDTPAQSPDLSVDQRSIIYRGSISVRVKDVTAAAGQVTGIASTAGGFIGSDDRTRGSGDDTATMELRVPADKFGSVVDQLSRLGNEEARKISTEDVTEQTVDLDARIAVQQARVDSGRKLLASAKSLSDLVMLEREVATRESDLASLQAKKRHVADLVALSTISITLLSPAAPAPKPVENKHGFLGGLAAGWHALLASLRVLLTVLGALLPWLIGVGLPALGVYYVVRRVLRERRSPRTQAVEAEASPADG
jgi:hypothetical protein